MTSTNRLAGLRTRLPGLLDRAAVPTVAVSAVLIVIGVVGVLTDHDRTALIAVLLLQGCAIVAATSHRVAVTRLERSLSHRIDQASARQLADLARTRHALLATSADEPPEGPSAQR